MCPVGVWFDPPPPTHASPSYSRVAQMPSGPTAGTRITPPASSRRKALRYLPKSVGIPGRGRRQPAQLSPLPKRKRSVLPGLASAASQGLNRNRLPETGRFHLGLKFCFQVHVVGPGRGGGCAGGVRGRPGSAGRGIKALVMYLAAHPPPSRAFIRGPVLTSQVMF